MLKLSSFSLVLFFFIAQANAFPLPSRVTEAQRAEIYSNAASDNTSFPFSATTDFEGIVALSNCSGALVRYTGSKDDDNAMVLTNGHCMGGFFGGLIRPGKAYINKSDSRSMTVLNPIDGSGLGKISAVKILYGTMTGTDMALFQMKSTYREILTKFNVRPLTLAEKTAETGTSIDILSGYWKKSYSCSIEKVILTLKEADYTFENSMRYSQPGCETIHGTSGSPIIQHGTRDIIGVNNTGSDDGKMCTMNNPCEVDETGRTTAVKGRSYGQQINGIYPCLNSQNVIDFSLPGCKLVHQL